MANIKKNFNFRNGVQVDDDNLLVTSTGLVGIGTTIPNEALDVRGNVVVTGFTSSPSAQIGVLTVTTFVPNQIVGAGLSVLSGIVTAQGSGILTYFGDARNLQGMPTSQWEDVDVGLGFTSIYNTGGNVGVGTEDPRTTLQVGNNVDAGEKGVGISSVGNINMTGILTATSFIGNVTGDVTGRITGDLVGNINSAGVSTFVTLDVNGDVDFDGHTNIDNLSVAGVSTFTGLIDGNGGATIDNVQIGVTGDNEIDTSTGNLTIDSAGGQVVISDDLSVTGVTTFSSIIEAPAGMNKVPSLYMNQSNLPSASNYHGMFAHVHSTGRGYFAHAMNWYELVNKDLFGVVGTGTERYNLGVSTISNLIVSGIATFNHNIAAGFVGASSTVFATKLGVGTTEAPVNDIQVRKSGNVEIQITSETGTAGLSIGRETGNSDTNNAEFRYGKESAGSPYSSAQSLDILNYGTGNFNYHLSANNAGAVDGDFHWHKGINNSRLMTLTGIGGSLGIGITNPSTTLHVIGQATVSGNVVLGGDLDVTGNAALNVIGQVTGDLTGNVNATTGVSTFKRLDLDTTSYYEFGELSAAGVGIGTTMSNFKLVVNQDADKRLTVSDSGNVGVKTDETFGNGFYVSGSIVSNKSIAIGSTQATCAVDFKNAGVGQTSGNQNRNYMLPPSIDSTQRAALQGVVSGAIIYNTTANKLQVYVGTGAYNVSNWENLH